MRHRLRDRASVAPSSAASRRRPARGQRRKAASAVPAAVEAGRDITLEAESGPEWGDTDSQAAELEALLDVEYSADWWKESEPDSAPLADLLQHLVGCGSPLRPHELQAADSGTPSAAGRRPKSKMAAAGFPRPRVRCQDNKNAVAARLNRLRKKEYVSELERSAARLADENQQLQKERQALGARVRELEQETRYLRAVLANDSSLSHLLGRLTGLGGVRLSTSLFLDPPSGSDHDYALPGFRQDLKIDDAEMDPEAAAPPCGVCLHVDKEKVSVEFCASCARKAASTAKM